MAFPAIDYLQKDPRWIRADQAMEAASRMYNVITSGLRDGLASGTSEDSWRYAQDDLLGSADAIDAIFREMYIAAQEGYDRTRAPEMGVTANRGRFKILAPLVTKAEDMIRVHAKLVSKIAGSLKSGVPVSRSQMPTVKKASSNWWGYGLAGAVVVSMLYSLGKRKAQ